MAACRGRERLVGLGDELLGGGDRGQRRDGALLGGADGAARVGEPERLAELLLVLKKRQSNGVIDQQHVLQIKTTDSTCVGEESFFSYMEDGVVLGDIDEQ